MKKTSELYKKRLLESEIIKKQIKDLQKQFRFLQNYINIYNYRKKQTQAKKQAI